MAQIPARQLLIGGEWRKPTRGDTLPVISPATEEQIGTIPAGGPEDVELAVQAAQQALASKQWAGTTGTQRAKLLRAIADKVRACSHGGRR